MNRHEIVEGAEYASDQGRRLRVVSVEPGWTVRDGKHVRAETFGARQIKNRGLVRYKNNISVAVEEVDTGRHLVIEPRRLAGPWAEYSLQRQAQQAALAEAVAHAEALAERAGALGLGPVSTDPTRETVSLSFGAFEELLDSYIPRMLPSRG